MINDAEIFNFIGHCYEKMEAYDKAIDAFEKSSYLIPHKLYPKYRLVPLYYINGQKDKAINLANQIVRFKEKIPSKEVDIIKKEAKEFLMKVQ